MRLFLALLVLSEMLLTFVEGSEAWWIFGRPQHGKCPGSHPYAYHNGEYCCNSNREGFYAPDRERCDRSIISVSSACCGGEGVRCPAKKCSHRRSPGPGKCPRSHPFAYLNGDYCCSVDHEKVDRRDGSRCDGSLISLGSSCCAKGNVRCPNGKCTNGDGAISGVTLKAPVITAEAVGNRIRFRSQLFLNNQFNIYEVRWYSVGTSGRRLVQTQVVIRNPLSSMQNTDTKQLFHMGTQVYAEVRALKNYNRATNSGQAGSKFFRSNIFFAGFKITPKLQLYNNGLPTKLTITQTVPILCQDGTTNCKVYIHFTHPNSIMMNQCTVALPASTTTMISHTVSVIIKKNYIGHNINGVITPHVTVSQGLEGGDWNNPEGPPVTITTTPVTTTGECSSTGDPHFRTFDGVKYNHYKVGEYTLVKNKARKFEVQTRTRKCARVSCNCGLAVREGDDVLVVDMCKGDFNPRARYGSNQEPQVGTYIERSHNGKQFILHFKSGARVTFLAKHWYGNNYYGDINVRLPPEDVGKTVGLCGSLDKNAGNDMTAKNGHVYGRTCGGQGCAGFTESWKVTRTESLFLYHGGNPTCLPTTGLVRNTFCACSHNNVFPFKGDQCQVQEDPTEVINKKGYKILAHPISKKCEVDITTIPIRPTCPFDIFPWEPTQPTGPLPRYPLPDGTTASGARTYCTLKMTETGIYQACRRLIRGFSITGFVANCVADIKLTGKKLSAALSAVDAMVDSCITTVTTDIKYWVIVGGVKVPPNIGQYICPNQCSGNGKCIAGKCQCNYGYTTDDCSLTTGTVPDIIGGFEGGLCDFRKEDCSSISVHVSNLIPGTAVTGYYDLHHKFIKLSFKLISFREIYVSLLQKWSIKYSVHTHGVTHFTYSIVISNDGHKFCQPKPFIVYDSKCMSCSIAKGCSLKPNTCQIRGYCFSAGEKDPNDAVKHCDPSRSTNMFVDPKGTDPCQVQNGGCSQLCMSEGSAVLCSCNDGFKLSRDGKTCEKANHCQVQNGGCSQVCMSEGSAVLCSCHDGFKLNKDGKTCEKENKCKGIADIGFALDSSGSLGDHYQDEKNFLKSLTKTFGISKDGSHAGVVTFSLKAKLSIKFNQYMTQESFDNAVDNIPHLNKFTRIDLALKLAKDELFSTRNGARPNVPKLCVLITDGSQTKMWGAEDPAKIAAQMRAAGIRTIAVGIGKEVKPAELTKIAGNSQDAYTAANFDELLKPAFADKVKKAMCANH